MADLQKTIEIVFGAVDKTGQGIKSVTDNIDGAVNKISGLTGPLASVADGLIKTEAAVAVLAAGFVAMSANEASKFGEKVEEIGSLINATPEKVNSLNYSIQQFALDSTSNFEQITQAVYLATSNLGDTSKAMDILAVAEKGAVVGATDLGTSTALLTRTMNAYGLVTDDSATNTANAERVMAAMFTTVQNGDINLAMLSDSIGKVASSASAASIPIETIGAAIAAITGSGVSADESMTLLNSLIKELLGPSKELSGALGGLSVSTNGLPAVMDQLKIATGGSAEKFYSLFNSSEAAKAAMILANDSAGKFHTTLNAMNDGVTNFNKNFNEFSGGMADSMQKMENAWTSMMITVGKPNQENFQAVEDAMAKLFTAIDTAMRSGAFDELYKFIDDFSDKFVATIEQIAKNLPEALNMVDFGGLLNSIRDLGFEFGGIFKGVDISTPRGLADAIQKIVDTAETMIKTTKGIVEAWEPAIKTIKGWIEELNKSDGETKEAGGNILGISQQFETFKGAVMGTTSALQIIAGAMTTIAGIQVAGSIGTVTTAMGAFATSAAGMSAAAALAGGAIGYGAGTGLAAGIDALLSKLTGSETSLGSWIYDLTHSSTETENASAKVGKLSTAFDDLSTNQSKIAYRLAEISQQTGVAVNSMGELNQAVESGKLIFNEATGEYEAAGKSVSEYGSKADDVAQGSGWLVETLSDAGKALLNTSDAAEQAAKGFKTQAEAQAYANEQFGASNNVVISHVNGLYQVRDGAFSSAEATTALADSTKEAGKAAKEGSKEWKTVQDVLLESEKAANDFKVKMGELANERYAIDVKAAVDLGVAQIEADSQRISAILDAMSSDIQAWAQAETDVWGLFADASPLDPQKARELKKAAEDFAARQEEAFAVQKELAQIQIEKLRAEVDRLNSGDPLIMIDAKELAPELEMVFDKILKYTQIKATQQGLSMLVGI